MKMVEHHLLIAAENDAARKEFLVSELSPLLAILDRKFAIVSKLHYNQEALMDGSSGRNGQMTGALEPEEKDLTGGRGLPPSVVASRRASSSQQGGNDEDDDQTFHSYNSDRVRRNVMRVSRRKKQERQQSILSDNIEPNEEVKYSASLTNHLVEGEASTEELFAALVKNNIESKMTKRLAASPHMQKNGRSAARPPIQELYLPFEIR